MIGLIVRRVRRRRARRRRQQSDFDGQEVEGPEGDKMRCLRSALAKGFDRRYSDEKRSIREIHAECPSQKEE